MPADLQKSASWRIMRYLLNLAGSGNEPLLPRVVKSIEDRTEVLTYAQEEKGTMRYRLREAMARQLPDFLAKVLAEIAYRVFAGK